MIEHMRLQEAFARGVWGMCGDKEPVPGKLPVVHMRCKAVPKRTPVVDGIALIWLELAQHWQAHLRAKQQASGLAHIHALGLPNILACTCGILSITNDSHSGIGTRPSLLARAARFDSTP